MTRPTTTALVVTSALLAILVATFAQCGGERDGGSPGDPGAGGNPTRSGATDGGVTDGGATAGSGDATATPVSTPESAAVVGERIRLLVSGSMHGKLEPCGCASGQLGGLGRRMMHIQQVRDYDLLIEGGDLVTAGTMLDVEKANTALQVLFVMPELTHRLRGVPADSTLVGPYHALGVGPGDLELPMDEYWAGLPAAFEMPIVAADLRSTGGGWPARAFVDYDVRGTAVRVTALTLRLPAAVTAATPPPLELLDPAAAWQRAMQGADADTRRVVMIHAGPRRVRELAQLLQPRPDLVIGVDDTHHEPPGTEESAGGVPVVYPGIRGRVLLAVTIARTEAGGSAVTQYDPVPLAGSQTRPKAGQDPDVQQYLLQHRFAVKELQIQEQMAGQLPTPTGHDYIGSKQCQECHPKDYEIWAASKHAQAWETLVVAENDPDRYGWPVTHYPDCVSCHVVGFRQQSGFVTYAATPELADVGCERCHGPGSAHAAAPAANKMGKVGGGLPSRVCTECHDFEQTPNFDYTTRWAMIQHGK